jgi:hypothetical protein
MACLAGLVLKMLSLFKRQRKREREREREFAQANSS